MNVDSIEVKESSIDGRASGKESIAVQVLRDFSELEQVRPIWQRWQKHPNCDIDFYQTIIHERPEIVRPHVMVGCRNGSPVALLAGRIEFKSFEIKIGYFTLFRRKLRLLTFPLGGFLGNASDEIAGILVNELINSLRQGEADLAVFEPVETASPLYRSVLSVPGWFGRDYLHSAQMHHKIDLHENREAFFQSLSPKTRNTLKRKAKKLMADHGGVQVTCFQSPDDLKLLFETVETIARKTYHRGLGVGFSDNPEMRARLQLEAERGWLRGYVLHLGGTPAAFWLGTLYEGVFHSNFLGYDPAFAKDSAGTHLVSTVIADFCEMVGADKPWQVDFGLGDAQYKQVFGNASCQEAGVLIFAPTLKGFALNGLRTSFGAGDRVARWVLARTNLFGRTKTLWRRLVTQSPSLAS